ncbi:ABC transporter permease [Planosporangium mesophilum]|uniref:ABC transporter permease n=1 Tax=Planosporangium mesophilum TaxID=689768 RepID=A0A8J3WY46_9ACTN|nr:ABC transporter permease [Planosporangium mesophilum]NJC81443.1 ABC transporter permease [Planosporangium mesophilum]GII20900.1 ABC transporter permease [Planosporangium mesophilum]
MGSTAIRIGPLLAIVLVALVAVTTLVAWTGRLGTARASLTASVRATVQLAAVSLVIVAVLRSAWLTGGFVCLMYAVATVTAGRRILGPSSRRDSGRRDSGRRDSGRRRYAGLLAGVPIACGVAPILAALLTSGLVPARPVAVVPIAGILIGGAMTATGLAGRRALDDLRARFGEYEAALALGFTDSQARRDLCRPAAAQALFPALDQTRTVGLVALPGAFVGVLLGGGDPVQAGVAQLLVLIGLLAVETVGVLVTIELVAQGLLSGRD